MDSHEQQAIILELFAISEFKVFTIREDLSRNALCYRQELLEKYQVPSKKGLISYTSPARVAWTNIQTKKQLYHLVALRIDPMIS